MAAVTATINVNINAANAAAQLAGLQSKVATMNKGLMAATAGNVMAQEKAIRRMGNVLNGSGMFTTGIRNVHTQLGRMHQEFDRGSTTMSKYRQNSKTWSRDHSRINSLAADRVRMLQSQYVALGKEMNGIQKAMQIKPDRMMREFGADAMYATQQQMLFRRNLQMGATSLVNWGKNTQWAGRQMMVGMGIPIALVSAGAIKSFNEIEKASIAFKRVYGDTTTSVAEKSQMLTTVQKGVAKEMMKYGIATADTLDVAAKAAATGAQGADLIAATRETMRLATLGNMDYQKALESTIAMQTAFGISAGQMGKKTDFLNAVENQTILSMEDMALAVPRVAPVIKGLGGGVEELAIMMTALRQGGVTAEQGANALKSGLASMINPTSTATEALGNMGINLDKIVKANKGDIIGTVQGLGKALEGLSKFKRQQALESLFGKYQYARMGALLKNINSKAVKETMRLAKAPASELAKMSEQELSQISESPMIKLRKSIEELKAAAAPLGAVLSDIGAKVISFITPMVSFFSNNSWARGFLLGVAGIAAVAGTLTMIVGVLANFAGSMVKAGMSVKNFFRIISGRGSLAYVASEELEASAAANSLASASDRAAQAHMAQANAAKLLVSELNALAAAQSKAAAATSAVGTKPVGVPTTPKSVAPVPTAPISRGMTQTQIAMANMERTHLGGATPITSKAEIQRLLATPGISRYASDILNRSLNELNTTGQLSRTLYGGDSRSIYLPRQMNKDLGQSGVKASAVAEQIAMQGQRMTMAPLMQVMGRNLGMTNDAAAAWATTGKGADISKKLYNGFYDSIAAQGDRIITDKSVKPIADTVINGIQKTLPAAEAEALRKSGLTTRVGEAGKLVSMGAPEQLGSQYKVGPEYVNEQGKKVGGTPALFRAHDVTKWAPPTNYKPPVANPNAPVIITDGDGRVKGKLVPETSQSKKLLKPPIPLTPQKPMKIGYSPAAKESLAARNAAATLKQPRQFTGMGLMGAGMIASTAMMGMQAAGKDVPAAAEYATQGLMGVGMAAMMFPGTMGKLSTGISAVAGLMGPLGWAVAATATVVAGSALIWKTLNQKWRRDGLNLGKAVTDTTQGLEETGQIFGKTGYVQKQIAKDQKTTTEAMSTGQQFLESDVGKTWLNDYADTAGKVGVTTATGAFAAKLTTAVVNGVMGTGDVKGVLASLTKQNAVMGSSVRSEFLKLVGGSMKNIDPFAASLAVNRQIRRESRALIGAQQLRVQEQIDANKTKPGFALTPGGTTGAEQSALAVKRGANLRSLMQQSAGLAAGAWSGTIATAFQNRLAAEAQLQQMIEARDALAQKKNRTADETKQMNNLTSQITNGTKALGVMDTQVHKTMDGLEELYNNSDQSQKDAMSTSIFESLGGNKDPMVKLAGDMLNKSQIGDQRIKFTMAVALESGMLQPESMMNMFNQFGGANEAAMKMEVGINTIGTGPAMDFFNSMATFSSGKQTRALQTFGNEFVNIATKAKLSAKEAGALAKALGATPAQAKDVRVNVKKGKVDDPTKGIKDKNIKVKGDVKDAKRDIAGLNKETGKLSGKEATVKAKIDGATKGISDLENLGKAADNAGKKKVKIDADTRQAEAKAAQVEAALSKGNPPPIPITAQDKASAIAVAVQAQIVAMQAVASTPIIISAINNASPTLTTIIGQLSAIQSKTVTITVNKVENDAIGGLVGGYASGGVHNGDGKVTGPGGPTDDKVNARLSNGEYVIRASSVDKYGTAFLNAVNRGMYEKQAYKNGSVFGKKTVSGKDATKEFKDALERETVRKNLKFDEIADVILKFTKTFKVKSKMAAEQFAKSLIDNFSPKQINTILKNKKGAGEKFRTQQRVQLKAEQRGSILESRAQIIADRNAQKAAKAGKKVLRGLNFTKAKIGEPQEQFIAGLDPEQQAAFKGLKKKDAKKLAKKLAATKKVDEAAAKTQAGFETYKGLTTQTDKSLIDKLGGTGIRQSAKLGISLQELDTMMTATGKTAKDLEGLANDAAEASKKIERMNAAFDMIDDLVNQSDSAMLAKAGAANQKNLALVASQLGVSFSDVMNMIDQGASSWEQLLALGAAAELAARQVASWAKATELQTQSDAVMLAKAGAAWGGGPEGQAKAADIASKLGISLQELFDMIDTGALTKEKLQELADQAKAAADSLAAYQMIDQLRNQSDAAAMKSGYNNAWLAKVAQDLGVSLQDVINMLNNGETEASLTELAKEARAAALALQYLQMKQVELYNAQISNNDEMIAALRARQEGRVFQAVTQSTKISVITQEAGNGANLTPTQIEAANSVREAHIAKLQAASEDLSKEYSDQLETFEKISQHQQAIANLEKGRLGVASALTVGDIAAAAAAASQQRADVASFTRDQMRNQLENQQQARNKAYENEINRLTKINRDINNEIAMITAGISAETAGLAVTFGGLVVTTDQLKLMAAAMGVEVTALALNFQALSNQTAQSVSMVGTDFRALAAQLGVDTTTLISALGGDFDAMTRVFGISMSDLIFGLSGQTELLGTNFSLLAQNLHLEVGELATGLGGDMLLQGQLFEAMATSIGADAKTLLVGVATNFTDLAAAFNNDLSQMASVMGLDIQTLGMLMDSTFRTHVQGLKVDIIELSASLGINLEKVIATADTYLSDFGASFSTNFTKMKDVLGADFSGLITALGNNASVLLTSVANDFSALTKSFNGDFSMLSSLLSGDFSKLAASMGTDTNGLLTGLGTKFTELSANFSGDWSGLVTIFGKDFTDLASGMGMNAQNVLSSLGTGFSQLGQNFTGDTEQMQQAFMTMANESGVRVQTLFHVISGSLTDIATTSNGNLKMLADGMNLDFNKVADGLSQKLVGLGTTFDGTFNKIRETFGDGFAETLQGMGKDVDLLLMGLGAQFGALSGTDTGNFTTMNEAFAKMADDMGMSIDTFMTGFTNATTGIQEGFSQSFASIVNQIDTSATTVGDSIGRTWMGMATKIDDTGLKASTMVNALDAEFSRLADNMIIDYDSLGDHIENGAALQLGVAATSAGTLQYILDHSVTPLESMNAEIKTLDDYIISARDNWNEILKAILAALEAMKLLNKERAMMPPDPYNPAVGPLTTGAGFATGGLIPGIGNTDSIPIMATPGEFIVTKAAAAKFGPTLQAMNSGSLTSAALVGTGGNVNIGNVVFQISGPNLDARDVADIAVRKMKTLDSATIRGGRF